MTWPPPPAGCYLCGIEAAVETPGDHLRRDYRERDERGGRTVHRPPLLRECRAGLLGRPALKCVDVVACVRRQHRATLRRRGIAA